MNKFLKPKQILIIGALFFLAFFFFKPKNNSSFVETKKSKSKPKIILKGTDLYLFGQEKVKDCHIKAEESKIFTDENKTECKNILCKISLTNKKDNLTAILKAPTAHIDHNKKKVTLPENVSGSFEGFGSRVSISSSKGLIDMNRESVTLQDNVLSVFKKTQKK